MSAHGENPASSADGLASLERLRQVEHDADLRLETVRGQNDRSLAELRTDAEDQLQEARDEADREAGEVMKRAQADADAEAARILQDAQSTLAKRRQAGTPDLTPVWNDVLAALFGEFT